MPKICYDCGKELTKENLTAEHVPAKNLYHGFSEEKKKNLITVTACFDCNNTYSKIDQELRDLIAVKSDVLGEMEELTGKGVRSILNRSSWKDRVYLDVNGKAKSVSFDYETLKKLHIKNFKALFFRKYGFPLPKEYKIQIGTDGDEAKVKTIQVIHDYVRDGKDWEVSGSEDLFKFILKDITLDNGKGFYESGDFDKLVAIGGVLVYHDKIVAVVMAAKQEFIDSCNPDKK